MHAYRYLFRTALAGAAFATVAAAQESRIVLHLESITWNPTQHRLTWTVAKGTLDGDGKFQPSNPGVTYEIDMDAAVMTLNGEGRRFSRAEAIRMRPLMDILARYAAESTVWWDQGQGEPLDGGRGRKLDKKRPPREEPEQPPNKNGRLVKLIVAAGDR
ncbi:MAG TPA: hypothetical protein VFL57_04480 [Bryobacteraceae bacterium]|nr:hypothetical protein [Bryobacteraceae bacterium]